MLSPKDKAGRDGDREPANKSFEMHVLDNAEGALKQEQFDVGRSVQVDPAATAEVKSFLMANGQLPSGDSFADQAVPRRGVQSHTISFTLVKSEHRLTKRLSVDLGCKIIKEAKLGLRSIGWTKRGRRRPLMGQIAPRLLETASVDRVM